MSWCRLTSGNKCSVIKTLGYARNDDAREALSKLRGAFEFYAPHPDSISSIILSEIEKSNQENVKFVFSKQVW